MLFLELPLDVIIEILKNLSLYELIYMEQINKYFGLIIRSNKWENVVKITKYNDLNYVFNNYAFIKYDLSLVQSYINDNDVIMLRNCHTLSLNKCKYITDKSVKLLGGCHTLNLSHCKKITDESIGCLGNVFSLNLNACKKITDNGVKFLNRCNTLDISNCYGITSAMINELSKTIKEFTYGYVSDSDSIDTEELYRIQRIFVSDSDIE